MPIYVTVYRASSHILEVFQVYVLPKQEWSGEFNTPIIDNYFKLQCMCQSDVNIVTNTKWFRMKQYSKKRLVTCEWELGWLFRGVSDSVLICLKREE